MFPLIGLLGGLFLLGGGIAVHSATNAQIKACTPDAYRLCGDKIPNVSEVKTCMEKNKDNLSPECKATIAPLDRTITVAPRAKTLPKVHTLPAKVVKAPVVAPEPVEPEPAPVVTPEAPVAPVVVAEAPPVTPEPSTPHWLLGIYALLFGAAGMLIGKGTHSVYLGYKQQKAAQ